jgi:hypothetical protein
MRSQRQPFAAKESQLNSLTAPSPAVMMMRGKHVAWRPSMGLSQPHSQPMGALARASNDAKQHLFGKYWANGGGGVRKIFHLKV